MRRITPPAVCCLMVLAAAGAATPDVFVSRSEGDAVVWAKGSPGGPKAGADLARALTASGPGSYIVIPYKMGLVVPAVQEQAFTFSTAGESSAGRAGCFTLNRCVPASSGLPRS